MFGSVLRLLRIVQGESGMDSSGRIERALTAAFARAEADGPPPQLIAAMRHAVFPGGARVRPSLCLAVAGACGDDAPRLTDAAAAAIELLHCASLVHDDLPCFDNASLRRDRPSVHAAFGESVAVLAGDALIVLAFETLMTAAHVVPDRIAALHLTLTRGVGMPHGIVAGQAWESEPGAPAERCRRAKTGALFVAATMCGAISSGASPALWSALGERLGEAYQVADDLLDALGSHEESGKGGGRDAALGRPNAIAELGVDGAVRKLRELVEATVDAIPPCAGRNALGDLVRLQAKRLVPQQLAKSAA